MVGDRCARLEDGSKGQLRERERERDPPRSARRGDDECFFSKVPTHKAKCILVETLARRFASVHVGWCWGVDGVER